MQQAINRNLEIRRMIPPIVTRDSAQNVFRLTLVTLHEHARLEH